jgi:gamma-glutamyl hercynylcysteine S-oxide synthase
MGPRWKEVQSDDEIDDLQVRLPVIGGLAPERYVPVVVLAGTGLLLLVLLFLPGLLRFGTNLTVKSAPLGASVYIDDLRVGSTPVETFVPAGTYTLSVGFPGFTAYSQELEVSGRLPGTLLFPLEETVEIALKRDPSVSDRINELMQEYHQWALAGAPGGQFQHPPAAGTLGRILWAGEREGSSRKEYTRLWEEVTISLFSAASPWQVPDALSGSLRSALSGAALHPGQMEQLVKLFIQTDNDYQSLYEVVRELADGSPLEEAVTATSWYDARRERQSTNLLANSIGMDERGLPDRRVLTVDGVSFSAVPEGTFISGYPLRDNAETGAVRTIERSFYIGSTEISNRQFALFLRENESWRPSARDELSAQGLADGRYLDYWPDDGEWLFLPDGATEADRPVRNISWFAARAYVQWMNRRFQESGGTFDGVPRENLEISLPDSTSWEYAAYLNGLGGGDRVFNAPSTAGTSSGEAGALGAYHLSGNLWEWTSEWYTRHHRALPSGYGAQRAVIGGSFANDPVPPGTVGGQPPEWSTPFLGFRPAIYRKSDL